MTVCLDVPPSLTCSFWNCSLASLSLVMLAAVQIVSVLEGRIVPISQKNLDCLQPQKPIGLSSTSHQETTILEAQIQIEHTPHDPTCTHSLAKDPSDKDGSGCMNCNQLERLRSPYRWSPAWPFIDMKLKTNEPSKSNFLGFYLPKKSALQNCGKMVSNMQRKKSRTHCIVTRLSSNMPTHQADSS